MLPPPKPPPLPTTAPAFLWRGTVTQLEPSLTVAAPKLAGHDQGVPGCESAVFDPALQVGDRVWVAAVEGDRMRFLVLARRA
ncbi:hypothetical protein [Nakamurella leprariae]|uniref:Uncharacterized protein n=1 Tax=Nakamurella leprariae TaxID=2803911 RepID=A0A938YFM6_9ACTN|nr:hypothetical protein [Nakamurella leprariae]MBM9467264.1 hypothetical protein [Nakamurella leprariae]